jgi:hypothetical protein
MKPGNFVTQALYIILIAFVAVSCEGQRKGKPTGDFFSSGTIAGILDNSNIDEASGLAASHTNPGMLWTHNDSGDKARIFLIDSLGRHRMTVSLDGIANRDWEDIAVGPGPDSTKTYVYVGDIGDNYSRHEHKYIYRIEEPHLTKGKKKLTLTAVHSIRFSLPDGPRDTEALMIDPGTRDLYIFSKREAAVNLYRLPFPQSTTEVMVAEQVLSALPFTRIVAADWSADGREILVKSYRDVYYWRRVNQETIVELLQTPPVLLPYKTEPQGESIAFDRLGKGYYTVSEKSKGSEPELRYYKRNDNQE